jgi:hypothetical protein
MAFAFQERYKPHIEGRMRAFWQTLSERDRRRFAALEAARLGHGGIEYIAEVLGCSTRGIGVLAVREARKADRDTRGKSRMR